MRRVGRSICVGTPLYVAETKRYARRRQTQPEGNAADAPINTPLFDQHQTSSNAIPDVSSLRSEGMMAAPATTSLDKIRSQLALMRSENTKKAAEQKAARAQQKWIEEQRDKQREEKLLSGVKLSPPKSSSERLTQLIQKEYTRTHKPNDVFRNGKEVTEGVAQRTFLMLQKRFRDADEVLRRTGKEEDTKRFIKLAFASSPEQTAQLIDLLQTMRTRRDTEQKALASSFGLSESDGESKAALAKLAWVQVLDQLSDGEVRLLWESGVLDAETISSLFTETPADEAVAASERDAENEEQIAKSDVVNVLLDEKINYVEQLHYLQELTSSIRETELGDAPSIDLAPTLVKVQRQQFSEITEEELRRLEHYGEAAAMCLSTEGKQTTTPKASEHSDVRDDKKSITLDVPASTLDRALTPTNSFLNAVAGKDAALKKSLEAMERIKREALLDPEFQEAVRFAHAVEEASIAPHIHGLPVNSKDSFEVSKKADGDDDDGEMPRRVTSKRERRAARSRQFRGPMARSPYSPEVVPYFYNDMRSIVPPRGAFNLPDPTPTKAERAEMRGRRRRTHRRSYYRK